MELSWGTVILLIDWALRITLSIRVILRKRAVGVSLAWLFIILAAPYAGAIIYLLVGENRLGTQRARRLMALRSPYTEWLKSLEQVKPVNWEALSPICRQLHQHAVTKMGIPALPGNSLELLADNEQALKAIAADIRQAQKSVSIEFYIWCEGGVADEAVQALIEAVGRGVVCRVLLDAVGSKPFLKSQLARDLHAAGVQLVSALPVSILRLAVARLDLRLHRKIVVIDDRIAYTGSMNMADARFFAKGEGFGQWVDALVRIQGPAISELNATFIGDWELQTDAGLAHFGHDLITPPAEHGQSVVQVVPSGPEFSPETIHQMLLTTIYAARRELIMTTPYFVPDEAMVTALLSAAYRGVEVTIVLPEKVNHRLVQLASHAILDDLIRAGVRVAFFHEGLLHTKTVSIDGEIGLIGSVNMDMRSFWLNFEVTLFVYDRKFTTSLKQMQEGYYAKSQFVDPAVWGQRSFGRRLAENAALLVGPVL